MKRKELDDALATVASWIWNEGEKKIAALRGSTGTLRPELCKIIAIKIFESGIDTRLASMDEGARNAVELIREALCAYNRDGFLEFDNVIQIGDIFCEINKPYSCFEVVGIKSNLKVLVREIGRDLSVITGSSGVYMPRPGEYFNDKNYVATLRKSGELKTNGRSLEPWNGGCQHWDNWR